MNECKHFLTQIPLWLDGELQSDEISQLESHLDLCPSCRDRMISERRFLETVRSSTPLYHSPEELRARVAKLLNESTPTTDEHPPSRQHPRRSWENLPVWHQLPRLRVQHFALLSLVVALVIAAGIWHARDDANKRKYRGPSEFALMAADTHRRYLQKQLPLEIVSNFPDQISAWFTGKVPFGVKLPDYQEQSGQVKLYQLEGARLVGYNGDYAAYVAYQMHQRPISLVVTSDSVARPAGGEEIVARGLKFHFDSIFGYKVITWSDRGLTYALVSDLEERGQQSCIVCHEGDQELLELDRAVSQQ